MEMVDNDVIKRSIKKDELQTKVYHGGTHTGKISHCNMEDR